LSPPPRPNAPCSRRTGSSYADEQIADVVNR
jgi:hypothetical protein